ncbi:hypothetical protein BP00DRAFT_420722 [Aspergillus indologenus CBS 114.80]|uniref:F-box domain protein n=1 Tax=Aspergillus indologenus CBS 114.80 TaxID=1450541 RepID=A0A2V5HRD9_9EURO|nr:hypothetical protein BP00DRAFT_420722 [Aspergillus indologenus CBS 114.80]
MDRGTKYRQIRICERGDLVTGFETLLHLLRNPATAQHVHHLEVHGAREVTDHEDPDFQRPPSETQELAEVDILNLRTAIAKAGFTEGDEPKMLLNILLQDPAGKKLQCSTYSGHIAFKQALAALLITASPQLESLAFYHIGEYDTAASYFCLVTLLRRANRTSIAPPPYLQNLRKVIFLSDQDSPDNDELHYIPESYYHRINLVRRLPALESIAFTLATWNNEAGIPPPPRSANYSEISFTHSMMHEADLCCLIDSAKALRKFTYTIGGRMLPEGGKQTVNVSPLIRSLWRHRHTLEELDLDVEDNVSWGEIYGEEGLEPATEELDYENDEEYQEAWAEELETLDVDLEPPPTDISLADFPKLRRLSLGPHTLCFLARGIGPNRWRGESFSRFSLVDCLPRCLEVLRIYGRGEEGDDPWLTRKICSPDLDVDAELVSMMAEKPGKLPTLTVEGFSEVIPRGRDVPEWAGEDHPLVWKQPVGWAC